MAEEAKFFYTNGAELALSPYDVTFKFLRNLSDSSAVGTTPVGAGAAIEGRLVIVDTLSVSMSPSHAKAVAASLLHLLSEYEAQYGEIPLASEIKTKWKEQITKARGA